MQHVVLPIFGHDKTPPRPHTFPLRGHGVPDVDSEEHHEICLPRAGAVHRDPGRRPGGGHRTGRLRAGAVDRRRRHPRQGCSGVERLAVRRGGRLHDPRHRRRDADPAAGADPADRGLLRQGLRRCHVGRPDPARRGRPGPARLHLLRCRRARRGARPQRAHPVRPRGDGGHAGEAAGGDDGTARRPARHTSDDAQGAMAAPGRHRCHPGDRGPAGLVVAGQPDAKRVQRHGDGVRRPRRRARQRRHGLDGRTRPRHGHQRRRPGRRPGPTPRT